MVTRHVPSQGHSRRTHGRIARPSHSHDSYLPPLTGAQEVYEQVAIDGVVGVQNIMPGAVSSAAIQERALVARHFLETLRPVGIVDELPELPHDDYPIGSTVVLTTDGKLYRNVTNLDLGIEEWTRSIDGLDLVADSVTSGAIQAGAVTTSALAVGARLTGEFANAENGATVVADATGLSIYNGAIHLEDASGAVALTGGGFGPVWRRFVTNGAYNGDFAAPPADPDSDIDDVTNPLPGWSVAQYNGTAITIASVADSSTASGRKIRFTVGAGSSPNRAEMTQIIPINGSKTQSFAYKFYVAGVASVSTVDLQAEIWVRYLKADGETVTGAGWLGQWTFDKWMADPTDQSMISSTAIPADAAYVLLTVGVRRNTTSSTTGTFDVYEVRVVSGNSEIIIPDEDSPDSYGEAQVRQASGSLVLNSGQSRLGSLNFAQMALTAATGVVAISASDSISLDSPIVKVDDAIQFGGGVGSYDTSLARVASGVLETTRLRLTANDDVGVSSSTHALQVGTTGTVNLALDGNEIQARNNGSDSDLNLNADGGEVTINANAYGSKSGLRIMRGGLRVGTTANPPNDVTMLFGADVLLGRAAANVLGLGTGDRLDYEAVGRQVYKSTSQAIPNNTWTRIGGYTTTPFVGLSTAWNVHGAAEIKVLIAGFYDIQIEIEFAATPAATRFIIGPVFGSNAAPGTTPNTFDEETFTPNTLNAVRHYKWNGKRYLAANTTVAVSVHQNSGGNLNVKTARFTVVRVSV